MANQTISFNAPGPRTFGDAPFTVSSALTVTFAASGNGTISGDSVT